MERSPLLLPRILAPLPGPDSDYEPLQNGREVCPADAIDRSGLEVCQLPDPSLEVCELPPVQSDSGTELGSTTGLGSLDTIVSDLTQILFSQDEAAVIASGQ